MADLRGKQLKDSYQDLVTLESSGGGADARALEDGEGNKIPFKVQTDYQVISSHTFTPASEAVDLVFRNSGQAGILQCARSGANSFILLNIYVNTAKNVLHTVIGNNILSATDMQNRTLRIEGFFPGAPIYVSGLSGNLDIESILDVEP